MALSAVSSMAQIWTNRPLPNLVSSLLAEVGRFIFRGSLRRVNPVYEILLMAQHDPLNICFSCSPSPIRGFLHVMPYGS
jgi:hypothetical protein